MDALKLLRQPYVFAVVSTVMATGLAFLYSRTTRATKEESKKFCCKLALFVLITNICLAYLSTRPDQVLQEPFYG